MTYKHLRIFSTLLVINEIQNKTTMWYYYIPAKFAKIFKRMTISSVAGNMEPLEPSCVASKNAKWHSHSGKQSGITLKYKIHIFLIIENFIPDIYPGENKMYANTNTGVTCLL